MASDQANLATSVQLDAEDLPTTNSDVRSVPETSAALPVESKLNKSLVADYDSSDSDDGEIAIESPQPRSILVHDSPAINSEENTKSFVEPENIENSSEKSSNVIPKEFKDSSVHPKILKECSTDQESPKDSSMDQDSLAKSTSVISEEFKDSTVRSETPKDSSIDPEKSKDPVNLKDYRVIQEEEIESGDSDSDSESIVELSGDSSEDDDSDDSESTNSKDKRLKFTMERFDNKKRPHANKTKGELDDLPPIEELKITVPEVLCEPFGKVAWMVEQLVVVKPLAGKPTLNLDSILFVERGRRVLGQVFDVFGQVTDPHYCVRFNSADHIKESAIVTDMTVYFCPNSPHTKLVFAHELTKMKGTDGPGDDEPPEFSDDEEEQAYKMMQRQKQRQKNENNRPEDGDEGPQKRKRLSWQSNNPWRGGHGPRGRGNYPGPSPHGWSPANGPRNFQNSTWLPPTPPSGAFPPVAGNSYGPRNAFDPFQPHPGQFGPRNANNFCQPPPPPYQPMQYPFDQRNDNQPPQSIDYSFGQPPRFRHNFEPYRPYGPEAYQPTPSGNIWQPRQHPPAMGMNWPPQPPPP